MTRKARILIAEDEGVVALDIQGGLEGFGYEVVGIASTADQVVAKAAQLRPDVVLMDINLKGKADGIDAAEKIRGISNSAIIFLTAHSDEATLTRARRVEPRGYILKPFEDNELRVAIELALDPARRSAWEDTESTDLTFDQQDAGQLIDFLRQLPIFKGLPTTALEEITTSSVVRTAEPNEYVWTEGERPSGGVIPLSGRFAATKVSGQGKELTVAIIPPGDTFALLCLEGDLEGAISLRAMLDSRYLWIPRSALDRARTTHPNYSQNVALQLGGRLAQAFQLAKILAHARVEQRILSALFSLLPFLGKGEGDTRKIFLTRKELAELCGTTPETSIRVTKGLEREGLIDLSRPGVIKILSVEKLRECIDNAAV